MRSFISEMLIVAAAIAFAAACASAKPDRKDETPKKPLPIPQIAGESQWGEIIQIGRKISIYKHDRWFVEDGVIRADGKLFVVWIERDTGREAPGLYTIHADGSIVGKWMWRDRITVDKQGMMHGLIFNDVLRVAAKPEI